MLLSNASIKVKSIIFYCCVLLGEITHAETNIYFPRSIDASIQPLNDIHAKPIVTSNRIYKFFMQLYHHRTYSALQPMNDLTGIFWPDVLAWNAQMVWIDLGIYYRKYTGLQSRESLYTQSFSHKELLDLFVKVPFGIGYRKFFSSTRLIGSYLYSESLKQPWGHLACWYRNRISTVSTVYFKRAL